MIRKSFVRPVPVRRRDGEAVNATRRCVSHTILGLGTNVDLKLARRLGVRSSMAMAGWVELCLTYTQTADSVNSTSSHARRLLTFFAYILAEG